MKKRTPISEIMTKDVITLNHTDDLETAEHLFKSKNMLNTTIPYRIKSVRIKNPFVLIQFSNSMIELNSLW